MLLRAGASCNIKDKQGDTPLNLAVRSASRKREPWRVQVSD